MNRSALLLGVSFVTAALHTGAAQAANPASDHRRFQLEQQQDAERRLELQRDLFAQERQLELQRFELDRQRLLQSIARQPLRPRVDPGRLG